VAAGALALALGAALVHATWNVLLAGSRDTAAMTGAALLLGVVLAAPFAIATGGVEGAAVPYIAASAALELVYVALLAAAYSGGELSVVYPVARGSAPVMVLALGALVLGATVGVVQALGVVAVGAGVLLVRPPACDAARDVAFGLAVGFAIAGYTLVDSEGLDHARPIAYLELVLAPTAALYAAALVLSGRGTELREALGARAALTGALLFGAYALVLGALQLAPPAAVAAVRESSVVFAALLAAAVLHERVGPARAAGAALVSAGVAAVALG
jgi:drug/metabolite transporter (DMT)-like permease